MNARRLHRYHANIARIGAGSDLVNRKDDGDNSGSMAVFLLFSCVVCVFLLPLTVILMVISMENQADFFATPRK